MYNIKNIYIFQLYFEHNKTKYIQSLQLKTGKKRKYVNLAIKTKRR